MDDPNPYQPPRDVHQRLPARATKAPWWETVEFLMMFAVGVIFAFAALAIFFGIYSYLTSFQL